MTLTVDLSQTTIEAVLAEVIQSCRLSDVTIEDPPMEHIIAQIYTKAGKEAG